MLFRLDEKTGLLFNSRNYTVINLYLYIFGPTHEGALTRNLIVFQVLCSGIAFFTRYYLSTLLYD
jgi:UDP-N-acetylglucosamine--dolichyl-phosphate N-acetylglucosaminephosphotransferase